MLKSRLKQTSLKKQTLEKKEDYFESSELKIILYITAHKPKIRFSIRNLPKIASPHISQSEKNFF